MTFNPRHVPVLLQRCVSLLAPAIEAGIQERGTAVVVDATLGMGGHTEALLTRFPDLTVVGLDRDTQALAMAGERLESFGDRFRPVHTVYDEIESALAGEGFRHADGVLFDLGVSSFQLDERERGFAYSYDAPLDMRMDATSGPTAADVVNEYSLDDLTQVLRTWGEERHARRIAVAIVERRDAHPILTTGELSQLIIDHYPKGTKGGHPAKRTFQALRVEVNDELRVLERAVPAAMSAVPVGGRVVAMSYQSLEDRIVKRHFASLSTSTAPVGLPVEPEETKARFKVISKGTERPTPEEIEENSRAAAARLRAVQRLRPPVQTARVKHRRGA
ncbi:MAG: 16S rRNA (cytosine(1402)-N(4))-methyltransferase RsmH [Galactobacter sp.]